MPDDPIDQKIKPCPFCGCSGELRAGISPYNPWCIVRCESCPACIEIRSVNLSILDVIRNAITAWNRRAGETEADNA